MSLRAQKHLFITACTIVLAACSSGVDAPVFAKKVLVIGWDGVRADALQVAETPVLDAVVAGGAYAFTASTQTETATVSAPGWLSLLTGVQPSKHLVADNEDFVDHDHAYPSFLARAKHDFGLKTAAACDWEILCSLILGSEQALDESKVGDENAVVEAMADWLLNEDFDVHFIHIDLPDHAGHEFGFSPTVPEYLAAIEQSDQLSGRLLAAIEQRATRLNEQWLIAYVTDHGGDMDGHGALNHANRQIHFVLSGDLVVPGELPSGVEQVDLHPTVLRALGLTLDAAWGLDGNALALAE